MCCSARATTRRLSISGLRDVSWRKCTRADRYSRARATKTSSSAYSDSLGTPNERTWPGVSHFPEYKKNFPVYPPQSIQTILPMIDPLGMDLLNRMLQYQPHLRISALEALRHPYFAQLHSIQAKKPGSFWCSIAPIILIFNYTYIYIARGYFLAFFLYIPYICATFALLIWMQRNLYIFEHFLMVVLSIFYIYTRLIYTIPHMLSVHDLDCRLWASFVECAHGLYRPTWCCRRTAARGCR